MFDRALLSWSERVSFSSEQDPTGICPPLATPSTALDFTNKALIVAGGKPIVLWDDFSYVVTQATTSNRPNLSHPPHKKALPQWSCCIHPFIHFFGVTFFEGGGRKKEKGVLYTARLNAKGQWVYPGQWHLLRTLSKQFVLDGYVRYLFIYILYYSVTI